MIDPFGPTQTGSERHYKDNAREVQSLLLLAAGAAWAVVAFRAWTRSRKVGARRRTLSISNRLLRQVFPRGLHA